MLPLLFIYKKNETHIFALLLKRINNTVQILV